MASEEEQVVAAEEVLAKDDAGEEAVAELDEDMQAAINTDVAASPVNEEEESDADGGEVVAEHLKEAVEGSFRMKRLLENDGEDEEPGKKKAKISQPEDKLIIKLLTKWQMTDDLVSKYVLKEFCYVDDLKSLESTNYVPDKFHWQKSAPDLLARYVNDCRERRTTPGGGSLDVVSTFKFRFKIEASQDKVLRALPHKDLRYVLNNFDGSKPLDEVLREAAEYEAEEETTDAALPDGNGVSTIGRFSRLELIDPLADAAVLAMPISPLP